MLSKRGAAWIGAAAFSGAVWALVLRLIFVR
jgi:hypothetical protein